MKNDHRGHGKAEGSSIDRSMDQVDVGFKPDPGPGLGSEKPTLRPPQGGSMADVWYQSQAVRQIQARDRERNDRRHKRWHIALAFTSLVALAALTLADGLLR